MNPVITQGSAAAQALKADIAANNNTVLINGQPVAIKNVVPSPDNDAAIAAWYNLTAGPAFWAWFNSSSLAAVGMAIKMSDVGNLTTANSTRLQTSFLVRPGGFSPAVQDDRALFGGLFSVAGASGTRANLLAIWQHKVSNAEKLFATGAGTQVTGDLNADGTVTAGAPATLSEEGALTPAEVAAAFSS